MQTPASDALLDRLAITVLTAAARVAAATTNGTERDLSNGSRPQSCAALLSISACPAGKTLDVKVQGRRLSTDAWTDVGTFVQVSGGVLTIQRLSVASYPRYRAIDTVGGTAFDFSVSGVLNKGTLAVDAVPEKFKTTTVSIYGVAGVAYSKAATTAILFTAAHPVTALKYGAILVQINAAGTISTLISGATQTTAQAYNTSAAAIAALPAPAAGNVALGYIVIQAGAGTWTANTDDMTAASDLAAVTFVDATDGVTAPDVVSFTCALVGTDVMVAPITQV